MNASKLGVVSWIALILVVIGGLNWGLVGLFGFDLVAAIFGVMSLLARVVYVLIALAALFMLVKAAKHGKACAPSSSAPEQPMAAPPESGGGPEGGRTEG